MSSWTQSFRKYWSGAPLSPLAHPGQSRPAEQVSNKDFSYITSEDLARHRPARSADTLSFKHNRTTYRVDFPAYALDDGSITVGAARKEAARILGISDPRRLRLFHKGRNFKDDDALCRDVGLISEGPNEIMVVVGDPIPEEEDSGESDDDDTEPGSGTSSPAPGQKKPRKRNNRNKKKKKKSAALSNEDTPGLAYSGGATGAEHLPMPSSASLPVPRSSGTNTPTPKAAIPLTPQAKLLELSRKLKDDLVPMVEGYMKSPPADKAKKEFEHKKFTETILTQVLIKLDGVETEGDQEARAFRKELVREAQGWLNKLDDFKSTWS